jgi:diguanylate cyclase (GGDEF)-like protein
MRFALLGMLAGLVAPLGLLLLGIVTDHDIDPAVLFVVTAIGGVGVLGGFGWLLGRNEDALLAQNQELARLSARLQELSAMDALTGIPNRRALDEALQTELARALRYGSPLSVVMVDLDHFKALNDRLGHQAGDAVLRHVARTLDDEKRRGDLVARYGGEEFLAILPHSDAGAATAWAERARERIAGTLIETGAGAASVTASFGVAAAAPERDTVDALVGAADAALYQAKARGRNRVAG